MFNSSPILRAGGLVALLLIPVALSVAYPQKAQDVWERAKQIATGEARGSIELAIPASGKEVAIAGANPPAVGEQGSLTTSVVNIQGATVDLAPAAGAPALPVSPLSSAAAAAAMPPTTLLAGTPAAEAAAGAQRALVAHPSQSTPISTVQVQTGAVEAPKGPATLDLGGPLSYNAPTSTSATAGVAGGATGTPGAPVAGHLAGSTQPNSSPLVFSPEGRESPQGAAVPPGKGGDSPMAEALGQYAGKLAAPDRKPQSADSAAFSGAWTGTYAGSQSGKLTLMVGAGGTVSGLVETDGKSGKSAARGTVDASGNLELALPTGMTFRGLLGRLDGEGSWVSSPISPTGYWNLTRAAAALESVRPQVEGGVRAAPR